MFGEASFLLTPCLFEQLGDGSTVSVTTPINVIGLTSGVDSVALGEVCLFALFVIWLLLLFCVIESWWRCYCVGPEVSLYFVNRVVHL